MAILVYGIIDPEYKTWFARKCVLVLRQLQSCATCCAPSDGGSTNAESTSGEADGNSHVMNVSPEQGVSNRNNPVMADELETRLSNMRAAADEHDGVFRDLAENEEDSTLVLTQCDI
jgi:hypothetical protein